MNCHRCVYISYSGDWRGKCTHPAHSDYIVYGGGDYRKKRNNEKCADFKPKSKCRECVMWMPGGYFRDGATPSVKGECYGKFTRAKGQECPNFIENNIANRKKFIEEVSNGHGNTEQ